MLPDFMQMLPVFASKVTFRCFRHTCLLLPVLAILACAAGCTSHPKGPPGKDVMRQSDFIDLLVEMHYYEGIYSVTGSVTSAISDPDHDTVDYYQPVLEKHGVNREIFRKTLDYYSYNPPQFEMIYNRVIDELNRRLSEAEMADREKREEQERADIQVVRKNLWNLESSYTFPSNDTNRLVSFSIPVEGPGTYTFTAQVRLNEDDIAENPAVNIWFWYDDGTEEGFVQMFRSFTLRKDGRLRQVTLSRQLLHPDVTHVKGRVLDMDNRDDPGERSAEVLNPRLTYQEPPDHELR